MDPDRSGYGLSAALFLLGWLVASAGAADEPPWPAPVKGWKEPRPGEHPRLFFRRSDLPEIRQRAQTPGGRKIVDRLRFLLNGGDGKSLPKQRNLSRRATRDVGEFTLDAPAGSLFTLWHAAGYGMLYHLTENKVYADLGRQCAEMMLAGQRDRHNRYAFISPSTDHSAGACLGAMAMAYDLCYDGWDDGFRRKVALSMQNYNQGGHRTLAALAQGGRITPWNRLWGSEVGGAALALLSIRHDPGVDDAKITPLLATNEQFMVRFLETAIGAGGYPIKGHHGAGMAADPAFVPALQAWRVAGGRDMISPRPHASFLSALRVYELLLMDGNAWYPVRPDSWERGTGNFAATRIGDDQSDRIGLRYGGQFAQGFGAVDDKYKPAMLWVYNHIVEPDAAKRTYDTVSVYPHRAVFSLVNWPIGMAPKNPAEILPKAHRDKPDYFVYRNRWKDETDILVTILWGKNYPIRVCGYGMNLGFGCLPGPTLSYYQEAEDGSMILSNSKGRTYIGVDFSRSSGAEALVAVVGRGAWRDDDARGRNGASAMFHTVNLNGFAVVLLTVQAGKPPAPRVEGDKIVIGGQTVAFDGKRIHFGRMARGPAAETRPDDWLYTPEEDKELADEKHPWPMRVKGWKAPKSGEHPRLFFRRADLPEIKRRAATPEGQVIDKRLRYLLNGSDGRTLPKQTNPSRESIDNPGNYAHMPLGSTFSLWHAAGYGMLYHLTGEKLYADLGRRCAEMMLKGVRDRDNRYSFIQPHGALRAGPSLGAMAMGYDLCYDGWDESFRRRVAREILDYGQGQHMSLGELTVGSRHRPESNHWGGQIGGAALALLAIWNDPGVDAEKVQDLLNVSQGRMKTQLTCGFGDGGHYSEGQGAGGIASDTAYIPALQAWRVAGGVDLVTPRRNASSITMLKVYEMIFRHGRPWYTKDGDPGTYGTGNFSTSDFRGMQSDRTGLSRAGQFAQGFGAVREKCKPAMLWVYNNIVERDPAKRTYDTVSKYPHRAVLSLVNWPIGMEPKNPADIFPNTNVDRYHGHFLFRNQWKDETDVVVIMKLKAEPAIDVWGCNLRVRFGLVPGMTFTHFQTARDGSAIISNPKGRSYFLIDFSRASGAEALVATVGQCARGGEDAHGGYKGASARFSTVEYKGLRVRFVTLQMGPPPVPHVEGDGIVVGGQTIRFDGKRFHVAKMAPSVQTLEKPDDFVLTVVEEQAAHEVVDARIRAEQEKLDRMLNQYIVRAKKLVEERKWAAAEAALQPLYEEWPNSKQTRQGREMMRKARAAYLPKVREGMDEDVDGDDGLTLD